MIGAVCFIAFLVAVAAGTFLLIRADARAEEAARRERDEQTRQLMWMLCQAMDPSGRGRGTT